MLMSSKEEGWELIAMSIGAGGSAVIRADGDGGAAAANGRVWLRQRRQVMGADVALWLVTLLLVLSVAVRLSGAAPVLAPNLRQCDLAVASSAVGPPVSLSFNCCLPLPSGRYGQQVRDFKFEDSPPARVRRPAHLASKSYIARYARAYDLMRALPSTDPRSLAVQANIHCAFCNGAYKQPGTNVSMQVHFSWLFLPWHRWYLYFHERILASLLAGDDPDFALLFWNWDNQTPGAGGNVMPSMFASDTSSPLYDSKRNQAHLPPELVRLNPLSNTTNNSVVVAENLNAMYRAMVTASTAELFMGGPYRTGTDLSNSTVVNAPLGGSIENSVHNGVHFWTGDPNQPLLQDMGTFTTASRDPIFYAHHSNVDRLWEVWMSSMPGGRRRPWTDADFLNAEFLFYDEKANLVRVRVRDALNNTKLGVSYDPLVSNGDKLWLNYKPQPATRRSLVARARREGVKEVGAAKASSKGIPLGQRFRALVKRPPNCNGTGTEVLVLEGLECGQDRFAVFVVFVNLPDADQSTPVSGAEFVGAFNVVPVPRSPTLLVDVPFEIGDSLQRIGIDKDTTEPLVVVTILVKTFPTSTPCSTFNSSIKGLRVLYQEPYY